MFALCFRKMFGASTSNLFFLSQHGSAWQLLYHYWHGWIRWVHLFIFEFWIFLCSFNCYNGKLQDLSLFFTTLPSMKQATWYSISGMLMVICCHSSSWKEPEFIRFLNHILVSESYLGQEPQNAPAWYAVWCFKAPLKIKGRDVSLSDIYMLRGLSSSSLAHNGLGAVVRPMAAHLNRQTQDKYYKILKLSHILRVQKQTTMKTERHCMNDRFPRRRMKGFVQLSAVIDQWAVN